MLPSEIGRNAPSLVLFDVNQFLKKTFSEYDVSRHEEFRALSNLKERSRSLRLDQNPAVDCHRDIITADSPIVVKPVRRGSDDPSASTRRQLEYEDTTWRCYPGAAVHGETIINHSETDPPSSGSGRRSCAYCAEDMADCGSTALYCASCTSFFTRYSPSVIQRRIEYDEGTNPISSPLVNAETPSGLTNNENVPLITGENVTRVSIHDCDGENGNGGTLAPAYGRPRAESDSNFGHRYLRNEKRTSRSGYGFTSSNSKSPYRRQQLRMANCNLRDKMDPLLVDYGRGVNWSNENGNSRRSSCTSASSWSRPTCRICHLHGEPGETLVSPCRCAGTMQYVHTTCLVHWLEISTKKVLPSPHCELCGYQYRTHHCYKLQRMYKPSCNRRDFILHIVFSIMLLIMIGCATLSALYLRRDKGSSYKRSSLNSEDIIVIASALLFFCAFFVAVFTQYRAETSVCRLCIRCWLINRHWRVKDYDVNLDYERRRHSSVII